MNRREPDSTPGSRPPFGIDVNVCYDSVRDRIYVGGGQYPVAQAVACVLDIKTRSWLDPKPTGAPGIDGSPYGTHNAVMNYDTANDALVLIESERSAGSAGHSQLRSKAESLDHRQPRIALATGQMERAEQVPILNQTRTSSSPPATATITAPCSLTGSHRKTARRRQQELCKAPGLVNLVYIHSLSEERRHGHWVEVIANASIRRRAASSVDCLGDHGRIEPTGTGIDHEAEKGMAQDRSRVARRGGGF